MLEITLTNPRAIPLVDICYQDGVFVVKDLTTEAGVVCLTADSTAEVVKDICNNYIQECRRDKR